MSRSPSEYGVLMLLENGPDRQAVLEVIVAGHSGDKAIARAGLGSKSAAVRAVALSALQRLEVLAPGDVLAGLGDADQLVVARAVELSAVSETSEAWAEVDTRLLLLLNQGSADIAEVCAWALGERHQSEADQDADGAAAATSESTRELALEVAQKVAQTLATVATTHADALVRESAIAALGCIGDPSTLWAVLKGCADKATVRRRAVIALAAFEGPEVDSALEAARADRDWQVRQAAEDLLS